MKKVFFALVAILLSGGAYAECTADTKTYTSCKPGYYLSNGWCRACPNGGTSADKNTGGISDCYLAAGTTVTDISGTYSVTADCPY